MNKITDKNKRIFIKCLGILIQPATLLIGGPGTQLVAQGSIYALSDILTSGAKSIPDLDTVLSNTKENIKQDVMQILDVVDNEKGLYKSEDFDTAKIASRLSNEWCVKHEGQYTDSDAHEIQMAILKYLDEVQRWELNNTAYLQGVLRDHSDKIQDLQYRVEMNEHAIQMMRKCDREKGADLPHQSFTELETEVALSQEIDIQELFWRAGKLWYDDMRKPGARFHNLDIVEQILPSGTDEPAKSEHSFPFKATDTNDKNIQCSRFSELLRKNNSLDHKTHLILVGEGGIGKTTTLMSAMKDTYDNRDKYEGEQVVPLFLELSQVPDSRQCHAYDGESSSVIHRMIYAQLMQPIRKKTRSDLFRECMNEENSIAKDTVYEYLKSSEEKDIKYAFLLDGLNEVSTETFETAYEQWSALGRILMEIEEIANNHPNVILILTGRNKVFLDDDHFKTYFLRGLDWDDISEYLHKVNKTDNEITRIENGDQGLLEILSIPMFLTMFVRLQDTEDISTRGELMKVFFHERFERRSNKHNVYRQMDASERIATDRKKSMLGGMSGGIITLSMQRMFFDILIPEIAVKMKMAQSYRISREEVRTLMEFLFTNPESLYYGKHKSFANNCFEERLQHRFLEDVICDFSKAYEYRSNEYCLAFLEYCESSMGILYKEGEKSYGFIHQHFRDYFAAVCLVNRMKIAYTAVDNKKTDDARSILKKGFGEPIDPLLIIFISEYLGEHHNAPFISNERECTSGTPIVAEENLHDRKLVSDLLNIYRGIDQENSHEVYNLIEILKRARKDLSGYDLHALDLRKCFFNDVNMDSCAGIDLSGALIDANKWFVEGHSWHVNSAAFNHDGRFVVTASRDTKAYVWDARSGKLVHSLVGHSDNVTAAIFSIDGKFVATASDDNTARIWETISGKLIHLLEGHTDSVNSITFSNNGHFVVTTSCDNTARVWDNSSGKLIHLLEGHASIVFSAAFSHDGKFVVTASDDKTACIWDAYSGKPIQKLEGHTNSVVSSVFSHDDKFVVTSSWDGKARIWEVSSGKCIFSLEGHVGSLNSAKFSCDGKLIVTASDDNTAGIWDVQSGKLIHFLKGHTGSVCSVAFSNNGRFVITASSDKTARIWDAISGNLTQLLEGHTDRVNSASFSDDCRVVVTASDDETVRIWDTLSGRLIHLLERHSNRLNYATFSSDGKRIVTASDDKYARIRDSLSGRILHSLGEHSGSVNSAVFSKDGRYVITASDDNTVRVWDASSGKTVHLLNGHSETVNFAAISPDNMYIVSSSWDKTAYIWNTHSSKHIYSLVGHNSSINSAVFSNSGLYVVTASNDCTARIWDIHSFKTICILGGHSDWVRYATFSRDDKFVVTASWDGTACIWDTHTIDNIHFLKGHEDAVNSATFSNDGKYVITASDDKTACLWDARTGKYIHSFTGHTDKVMFAVFSPDDRFVVTASKDNTARIWDTNSGEIIRILYEITGLHIEGVDFRTINQESIMTEKQKEIFRQYGAII